MNGKVLAWGIAAVFVWSNPVDGGWLMVYGQLLVALTLSLKAIESWE